MAANAGLSNQSVMISIPLLILAGILWIHCHDPAYGPEWYLHHEITQYGK